MKTFLKKTIALACFAMLMPLSLLAQDVLKVHGTYKSLANYDFYCRQDELLTGQCPACYWSIEIRSRV